MSIFKKIMNSVFGKPEPIRVVVLGMDSAGKSTILYKLRAYGEEIVDTYPTIGFNIETLEKRDMTMTCWDVGGCDKIRPLWKHFCENMSVLVYVIDAYDRDRLPPAADEFNYFLNDSTVAPTLPILVIANKQDYPKAMSITEITEKMDLHYKLRGRQWCVIPCCAASGDGVADIVQWIKSAVSDKAFSLRQSEPQEPSAAPTESFGKIQQGMRTSPGTAASNNESAVPSALDFDTAARNKDVTAEVAAAKATEREVTRQSLLEDWLRRAQEEAAAVPSEEEMRAADDAFIAAIEDASLPMWDHYTHIKLGFLVLLSASLETADRQREESYSFDMAVHRVCGLIEGFIARSSRTNGRSFHCTMTHFWCHMIAVQLSRVTTAHVSSASGGRGDGSVSFVSFIESLQSVEAIELWDGKLFSKYYSSPVMFGGDARNQFVAPDLQPFPAL